MKKIHYFLSAAILLMLFMPALFSEENKVVYSTDEKDAGVTLKQLLDTDAADLRPSSSEVRLYQLIMKYRQEKGLEEIPYSKSLSLVAKIHVRDLQANPPSGRCNEHSWSKNGPWTGGCYTPDHARAKMMWDKPRELTKYKGDGFEIASYYSADMTPDVALESWQGSKPHNAVILNLGIWKSSEWKAIGIGIYQNYSVVWFGTVSDPVE